MGIGGSASVGMGKSAMSSSEFLQYQQQASAYRSAGCSSSSGTTQTGSAAQYLSRFIDPNIVAAYSNCLALYAKGLAIKQTSGEWVHAFGLGLLTHYTEIEYSCVTSNLPISLQGSIPTACQSTSPTEVVRGFNRHGINFAKG
jgi:hypothetical protein